MLEMIENGRKNEEMGDKRRKCVVRTVMRNTIKQAVFEQLN